MAQARPADLPAYAAADVKAALLAAGASGTIYSLVMPESEAALAAVVAGPDFLDRYREPWTQKQDSMHEAYFDEWLRWSAPVVSIRGEEFPFRYPTAGASEAIFKLLAEFASERRAAGREPTVHMFEGEYEGFAAYADALKVRIVRHDRAAWNDVPAKLDSDSQFWISQPSAIDGTVWPDFEAFVEATAKEDRGATIVPDLTYVGSVARDYRIALDSPAIPAIVISHSKPFGGYYHRVGGVLARREHPSLFGNKWFKNLLSLAWGTEMMRRHGIFELPRKYRPVQEEAARRAGRLLGVDGLVPTDVLLLATAEPYPALPPLLASVLRGSPEERVVRLCMTPAMTCLIDPAMAPATAPALRAAWDGRR
ncbi:MAG: hypothetical protein QOJ91_977 [Sphingomonadales bacterium]|jgi:hypothetical protein|nr:hypothetical protein [Sphingomonadales bacterium]